MPSSRTHRAVIEEARCSLAKAISAGTEKNGYERKGERFCVQTVHTTPAKYLKTKTAPSTPSWVQYRIYVLDL
jgi:hypothetical protein